ncbi:MAG: HAMP domain-containing protein, partial [Candidatus Aenigmarchaeota archaeon]|nr:HAMP domain-containing protein [Candidatus Aenigmarchaeota archaeon]
MDNGLKLSHKLILIVVIPVVIFSVVFEITFYSISRNEILEAYKKEAVSFISLASRELRNPLYFLDLDGLEHTIQNIKQNPDIQSVYVMFPDGRIITDGTLENKHYNETLNDCIDTQARRSPDEPLVEIKNDVLQACAPIVLTEKIGMVRADFSLAPLNDIVNNLIITLIMIGGIISIIVIIVGLFISRSISKPILKLKHAANEISKGNFNVDIRETSRNDEIAELSSQFNIMKQSIVSANKHLNRLVKDRTRELEIANEQLKNQEKMQKEFINIAAHELRTPIQPILGLSEVLRSKEEDEEKRRLIDIISRNAKRLQRLTQDILDVTRIESQLLRLNKEKFNLNGLILSIIEEYKKEIGDNNRSDIKLLYNPIEGNNIIVDADRYRITQIISNLLDNAIKFTKEGRGGTISLNVK